MYIHVHSNGRPKFFAACGLCRCRTKRTEENDDDDQEQNDPGRGPAFVNRLGECANGFRRHRRSFANHKKTLPED
jgi:hypothetical protein